MGDRVTRRSHFLLDKSKDELTAYDKNADVSIRVWKRERNGISTVSNNTYHLQNEREIEDVYLFHVLASKISLTMTMSLLRQKSLEYHTIALSAIRQKCRIFYSSMEEIKGQD